MRYLVRGEKDNYHIEDLQKFQETDVTSIFEIQDEPCL